MRSGPTFQQLFNWAYNYRLNAMREGGSTPILDFIVFRYTCYESTLSGVHI
jgi:hypothetical protein